MELCIGTVQFGMDYGILGGKKPSLDYAVNCIDYAVENGITSIDTAAAYGTAEEVVGEFLRRKTVKREKLFISTKFLPNLLDEYKPEDYKKVIRDNLIKSLEVLHTDYIDAYMFHSARYAFQADMLEALYEVQKEGLARKVGVSVYEPEEALACFASPFVSFIQMPYSVFDHRMKASGVLDSEKKGNCEVTTRSAFLQGLITMKEEQVPPFLERAKPIVERINQISQETGYSKVELAIAYVKRETAISRLVFGVDSLEQLKEDILLFHKEIPKDLLEKLEKEFEGLETDIVMPSLWKK